MTEAEKKMKKYTNAVERRLNLPREVKNRVMSDFCSSIAARREAGMTDEAIYAELGNPKKAVSDLNEQMKEYCYRKSPWRFAFLAAAVYGIAELLGNIVAGSLYMLISFPVLAEKEAASIGIIGGADGPTAIFVTTPSWTGYILPVLCLVVGLWGYYRLRRCKQK